ncbi:transcriptional regulator [Caldivirga sp. UBA161]|uniref:transcriptional regulator n=1 Tax=Caldivirga sp. UBA161 TaxID=1915569 RepID=UPI0025C1265D|nr:transcriptional regulator [Caldivirga sp. UBA161]
MRRDSAVGVALMVVGVVVIVAYGWLVFATPWWRIVLQLTGFVAIAAVFGILAWIGYALATTPPPKPIEEIEKEIQEELQKLQEEEKKQEGNKESS